MMDWSEACRILGIPESATESEIKDQYIYKAQLLHPDKNQDKPENVRKRAEAELALVNQAYTVLNNPNNNPYRIPPKLAIEPAGIRFKDVRIGERRSTTFTVRNIGGPYTSIWIDNQPAPWLAVIGVKSITSDRLPLEVTLECTGTGEAGRQYTCDLPVKLENENTHAVDNAVVKVELYTGLEPFETGTVKNVKTASKKSKVEVPLTKPETPLNRKGKMVFSIKAFLLNFLAFALLGVVAAYLIWSLWIINEIVIIGLILYSVVAFGLSFNHGLNWGSKADKSVTNNTGRKKK
jgi:hypothetical protein